MTFAGAITPDPRLAIGSNNPPAVTDYLGEKYEAFRLRVAEIAEQASTLPERIDDEAGMEAPTRIVKDVQAAAKEAEQARKVEKEPHLQAGRDVDAFFKTVTDDLDRLRRSIEGRIGDFLRRKEAQRRAEAEEQARILREQERERLAKAAQAEAEGRAAHAAIGLVDAETASTRADAAERVAQASSADLARTRTGGATATIRTEWTFEILDREALRATMGPLGAHFALAAVEQAIRDFIRKGGRDLPGVRIFQQQTAKVI